MRAGLGLGSVRPVRRRAFGTGGCRTATHRGNVRLDTDGPTQRVEEKVSMIEPGGADGAPAPLSPVPADGGAVAVQGAIAPGFGAGGGSADASQGFDVRRYMAAVFRHKWVVALALVVGAAGGVLMARFKPPVYEAQATVLTVPESPGPEPITSGRLFQDYAWVDLLKSFSVLDEAVRELRLYVDYRDPADSLVFSEFGLQERFSAGRYRLAVAPDGRAATLEREGIPVETVPLGDSIGGAVGFRWRPDRRDLRPQQKIDFEVWHPRDIAARLATELSARIDQKGNFLHIRLQGRDPARIAGTVNAVVNRFVEQAADIKRGRLSERVAILDDQLQRAERNLREAEEALERYKVETITLPSERAAPIAAGLQITQDPVLENFFAMQVELEGLQRDREAIDRVLAERDQGDWNPMQLEVLPQVQGSSDLTAALRELAGKRAELRALERQFTDRHPQVIRTAAEVAALERQTVPALAAALMNEIGAREQALRGRLASAGGQLERIPPRRIQEARLERNVVVAEGLYTMLQGRHEEARLAEVSSIPDVSILDPAVVPRRPVFSEGPRFIFLGVIGGLGVGLIGAIVLDRLDRRVRYPDHVTHDIGLSILGVVPSLKGGRNGVRGANAAPVIEAFRGIRLNLLHAHGTAGTMLATVTSPGSGDGKSFVASNLALALAEAGMRTLLLDADTRKGAQHRVLSLRRKPGLTDHLAGNLDLDRVVQPTSYPNLHFIGGGTRVAGAPELLASPAMVRLLAALRSRYDAIIVDSPPLGAGVDAFALGAAVGNVLVVLRTGRTDKAEAGAKLDMLERLPIRLLGAVLNDVKGGEGYGYRYYSYYMAGYDYQVEAETDDDETPALAKGSAGEG